MSRLHLVSLPLDLKPLRQWAARRGLGIDEGRALHHLLSETFGKGALQPFRLMVAPGAGIGTLYAYTTSDQASLRQTARESGLPDALAVCNPTRLAVKTMPESWAKGRRLAFDVRTRPVKRLLKPAGVFPKGAEVDAFLVEVLRRFPDGPPANDGIGREKVYRQWLAERLGAAAVVTQARIVRLERRAVQRGGKSLDGPDVTFHGELAVADETTFAETLAKGVGRHTAYGYGMLLLRPAR
ncbi:MAG: type I-E CRISPR-associated protein Cas6/Cse3/CasE [Kiloniellales bacterium]|nr:type I-E CRISPR-associated protein Cas6/Cse3/CasE [Kiloniellales bacterium]